MEAEEKCLYYFQKIHAFGVYLTPLVALIYGRIMSGFVLVYVEVSAFLFFLVRVNLFTYRAKMK